MDKIKQTGKTIRSNRKETDQNTRRIAANLPLIERKLDVVSGTTPYLLDFPLTDRKHSVILTLQVRPDNCCDCEPGANAQQRNVFVVPGSFGPYGSASGLSGDGIDYPATYIPPLEQTSTNFNYAAFGGPWWHSLYEDYNAIIGGYELSPEGWIIIPYDGMYTVLFKMVGSGQTVDQDSAVTASIKRLPMATDMNPSPEWEVLSRRTYATRNNTICWPLLGGGIYCGYGNFNLILFLVGGLYMTVYAACIPLHKGDRIAGWLKATNIDNWLPLTGGQVGSNKSVNGTVISLIGLGFGTVTGIVKDQTETPLSGATISYSTGFGGSTTSGVDGRFTFTELAPAQYVFTASKTAYNSHTYDPVIVKFDEVSEVNFILTHV